MFSYNCQCFEMSTYVILMINNLIILRLNKNTYLQTYIMLKLFFLIIGCVTRNVSFCNKIGLKFKVLFKSK